MRRAVASAAAGMTGDVLQAVPAASAVKVDGRRSYARMRAGETVTAPPRHVTIRRLEIRGFDETAQRATIAVECSKGTYVRQIAADLGEATGAGAYCLELRRTAVGEFDVSAAGLAGRCLGRPDGPVVPGAAGRPPAPSSPRARLRGGRGGAPRTRPRAARRDRPGAPRDGRGAPRHRRAARRPPATGGGARHDRPPEPARRRADPAGGRDRKLRRRAPGPPEGHRIGGGGRGGGRPALGGRDVPSASARGAPPGARTARAVVARAQGGARGGVRPRRAGRHPVRRSVLADLGRRLRRPRAARRARRPARERGGELPLRPRRPRHHRDAHRRGRAPGVRRRGRPAPSGRRRPRVVIAHPRAPGRRRRGGGGGAARDVRHGSRAPSFAATDGAATSDSRPPTSRRFPRRRCRRPGSTPGAHTCPDPTTPPRSASDTTRRSPTAAMPSGSRPTSSISTATSTARRSGSSSPTACGTSSGSRAWRPSWSSSIATSSARASSRAESASAQRTTADPPKGRCAWKNRGIASVRRRTPPAMDAHTATQNTAFVPASFELLPMLTVEENVVFPLRLTGTRPIRGGSRPSCGRSRWTAAGRLGPADLSRG